MGIEVHIVHHRADPELKARIEGRFAEDRDRLVAWGTVEIIRNLYPDLAARTCGELVEDTSVRG